MPDRPEDGDVPEDLVPVAEVAPAKALGWRRRHRRRLWFIAVAVALVALVGVVGVRWLHSASSLWNGVGNQAGAEVRPGQTLFTVGMVSAASKRPVVVQIRSVTPRISFNSAGATVRVLLCKPNGGVLWGFSLGVPRNCSSTRPFEPGEVTLGGDGNSGPTSIILAITVHRAGYACIDGVHVEYRDGLRSGAVDSGMSVVAVVGRKLYQQVTDQNLCP